MSNEPFRLRIQLDEIAWIHSGLTKVVDGDTNFHPQELEAFESLRDRIASLVTERSIREEVKRRLAGLDKS